MTTLNKQPSESKRYKFDFKREMSSGDKISTVSSISSFPEGLTLSDQYVDDTYIEIRISGGVAGSSYEITAIVETEAGDIMEGEGILIVEDDV